MGRLATLTALALAIGLGATEQAAACSCAGIREPLSLRGEDAAVTVRLLEVEPDPSPGHFDNVYVYKVRRVFKGRHQYDLHRGTRLRVRSALGSATCGLPRNRRKLYGLILDEGRRGLSASVCTVVDPALLRDAAEKRGSRPASSAASGVCSR
jgi:hypothetical protein